ncbi:MAG TPA: molybdopterin-dependent oxidoreductase, partial [Nitrospirota bacterium]
RLCAMKFVEGPVKGVQMSCMTKAMDGMVVSTTDGESARLRRMVIEWLMLNHPHDCPVCDEGGMCLLQDYTESSGHGMRRYKGKKRVFTDQYLGGFIQHEMNRCIQCYRCARFYQDYAGGDDFGPMQNANRVYFGRVKEGWLDSPFSGNLADICPTGVLTDKTFRFKARVWDLETAPSVCPHCSLGCNVTPGGRYRELLRVVARENSKVNGWFICDRGRFGHGFSSNPERPRTPLIDGAGASREDALKAAADRLFGAAGPKGGGSVAFLASPRASAETCYALGYLADALGSENVCFSADPVREKKDIRATARLAGGLSRPLMDIGRSDVIVVLGADPVNEAPMLALMMRQATREGAKAYVIDPRPVELPFEFTHIPAAPGDMPYALDGDIMSALKSAKTPAIIAGTDISDSSTIDRAAEVAASLKADGLDAGLFYIMAGPNSFGGALMARPGMDFDSVLEGIMAGRINTLVVAESTPLAQHPDVKKVRAAFDKLDSLIVIDYLPTGSANRADVFIPSVVYAEDDGVFVNNEGRAQMYSRAYTAGIPINRMGPDMHPPREFFEDVPGSAEPAWKTLLELSCILRPECPAYLTANGIRHALAASAPVWAPLATMHTEGEGVALSAHEWKSLPEEAAVQFPRDGLSLVTAELTFGTEELSSYSAHIEPKVPEPYIVMNKVDAEKLGIRNGALVEISAGSKSLECTLMVSEHSAKGVVIAPRIAGWPVGELAGKVVRVEKI